MNFEFNDDDFEVISSEDVERSARGRKPSPEAEKVASVLVKLSPGQAVAIRALAVAPASASAAKDRARVGAVIRSGARLANVKVRIAFRPSDGVPQVTVVV